MWAKKKLGKNRGDVRNIYLCEVVDDLLDAKEINDTQSALDLSYEVVTKSEHQEVDPWNRLARYCSK